MTEDTEQTHGNDRYGYALVQQGDIPNFVEARNRFHKELIRFIDSLRNAGADVPANAGVVGVQAVVEAGFDRQAIQVALRTALVSSPGDIEIYDRQFPSFWRRLTDGELIAKGTGWEDGSETDRSMSTPDSGAGIQNDKNQNNRDGIDDVSPDESSTTVGRHVETFGVGDGPQGDVSIPLVNRSDGSTDMGFDNVDRGSGDRIADAVEELSETFGQIRGRSWTSHRNDGPLDIRRALRSSTTTGGVVTKLPRRARAQMEVRATVIADVSESVLDVIDRKVLLEFLHAAVSHWRTARIFFFDTDLKEVTAAFNTATLTEAGFELERAEAAWGGGTRIGESLATLRRVAPRAVDRRTVVLIISDGLDIGALDELAEEMAWLRRTAPLVVWLNPLAGRTDYEPTARGMATALPYVDGLFPFTSPIDLQTMAVQLRRCGLRRCPGYQLSDAY